MRIATLSNAAVFHTVRWVRHFRARGHEVRVWSLEPPMAGFECERLPAPPLPGALRYPLAAPALARALRAFRPDLVDAHYVPNYGLLGVLAGVRPLSVTAWGSDLLVAGGRDPLQRLRARHVLGRADLILADGDNLAAAAAALGAPRERLHMVPWGVDRSLFRPGERESGLLVSTRMHEPVYDLETLLRGVAPVMHARADTRLVVAGDGSLRAELERLAAAELPRGRWSFVGRLAAADMAALLGRSDVFLSASLSDSTSVSLLEAMAAGAVPVVSDIEGNRPWVRDGDNGRTFRPGDAAALSAALEAALGDAGWRGRARAAASADVAQRGDWQVNLARIERLFEALASGRSLGTAGTP